ncbi:hypothetical protein [Nonomuraea aridisoli]|uniref:hypothetical protein n=1 Tax=Nonomuraea aridisoli TaxID=2070368 RepID=UPI0015E8CF10|nr:hypothetical protein [Nonomuraea aridisoli]
MRQERLPAEGEPRPERRTGEQGDPEGRPRAGAAAGPRLALGGAPAVQTLREEALERA